MISSCSANIEFDEMTTPPYFWGYLSLFIGIFKLFKEETTHKNGLKT